MLRPVLPKKGRVCTTPISHEPVPDASLKVVFHQQRQKTAALQDASRSPMPKGSAPAFGLRQSSGAFERRVAAANQRKVSPSPCRVASTAAEDCRTPGRSAFANAEGKCASFWTAPVLWRFRKESGRTKTAQGFAVALPRGINSGRRLPHSKAHRVRQY